MTTVPTSRNNITGKDWEKSYNHNLKIPVGASGFSPNLKTFKYYCFYVLVLLNTFTMINHFLILELFEIIAFKAPKNYR